MDAIADVENLRVAFCRACRGKRFKAEVLRFRENLDAELVSLRSEFLNARVNWGPYHTFQVYDPKQRMICAAPFRARVAHHAIISVCEPVFDSYQIFDSYACRKGKGLDAALARATRFSRTGHWYLKMDVRKYFDSISHAIMLHLLERRFRDSRLLQLFHSILDTYEASPGKGVPIGNLTSQYFANHYLGLLDHYVKETMKCSRYIRYMDDFVLWSNSKEHLKTWKVEIEDFLRKRLELQGKPINLNTCHHGMSFLGYRIFPNKVGLAKRSRDRFRRKASLYVRLFQAGIWDERDLARHMEPLLAFVKRCPSRAFRQRAIQEKGLCPEARTA